MIYFYNWHLLTSPLGNHCKSASDRFRLFNNHDKPSNHLWKEMQNSAQGKLGKAPLKVIKWFHPFFWHEHWRWKITSIFLKSCLQINQIITWFKTMLAAHNQFILCAIWPTKCNIMRNIELSLSKDVLVAVNIISVYHRHRQMANS